MMTPNLSLDSQFLINNSNKHLKLPNDNSWKRNFRGQSTTLFLHVIKMTYAYIARNKNIIDDDDAASSLGIANTRNGRDWDSWRLG